MRNHNYNFKNIAKWASILFAFVVSAVCFGKSYDLPFPSYTTLDYPIEAFSNKEGENFIVDEQRSRINIIDAQGKLIERIIANGTEESIKYVGYALASDENHIYVSDVDFIPNTIYIKQERILSFSKNGKYEGVLLELEYPENSFVIDASIVDIHIKNGEILVSTIDNKEMAVLSKLVNNKLQKLWSIKIPGNPIYDINHEPETNKLLICTYKGEVFLCDQQKNITLIHPHVTPGLVNNVDIDEDGAIYLLDTNNSQILQIKNKRKNIIINNIQADSLDVSNRHLVATDYSTNMFHLMDLENRSLISNNKVKYALVYEFKLILIWTARLYLGGFLLINLIRYLRKYRQYNPELKNIGLFLLSTILVTTMFSIQYYHSQDELIGKDVKRLASFISQTSSDTIGDDFANINSPSDYTTIEFIRVKEYLDSLISSSAKEGINCYYQLYKINGEKLFTIMDCNDQYQIGTMERELNSTIYQLILEHNLVTTENSRDGWGSYQFSKASIYDSNGNAIGIIEIGEYLEQNYIDQKKSLLNIIIPIMTVAFIILLLMIEFPAFKGSIQFLFHKKAAADPPRFVVLRPLGFTMFFAFGIDSAFCAIIGHNLYGSVGSQIGLESSIPITIHAIGCLLGIVLINLLSQKIDLKKLMLICITLQVITYLLTFFFVFIKSYYFFTATKFLLGLNLGAIISIFYIIPTYEKNKANQFSLFKEISLGRSSGSALGMALSGYIAQYLGYSYLYLVGAIFMIISFFIIYKGIDRHDIVHQKDDTIALTRNFGKSLKRFFNFKLIMYCLGISFTLAIMSGFSSFLFPLYSEAMGFQLIYISSIIIFAKLVSNILGNTLTLIMKKFNTFYALLVIHALPALFMVLFMFNKSYLWAILIITTVQIAIRIVDPYQNMFFLKEGRLSGLNNRIYTSISIFLNNIYLVISPLLYGVLIFNGYEIASFLCGLMVLVLLIIFAITMFKERENMFE